MGLPKTRWLLMGLLSLGIVVSTGFSQGPGGFGKGGRGGGEGGFGKGGFGKGGDSGGKGGGFGRGGFGGGGGTDGMFMFLAGKDKDGNYNTEIDVSKVEAMPFGQETSEQVREKLGGYLRKQGITTGRMSKDVFLKYNEEVARPEMSRRFFDMSDADKDGKITKAELEASAQRSGRPSSLLERFAEFDKNGNGSIEFEEYDVYMKERMGGGGGRDDRGRADSKGPPPAAPGAAPTPGASMDDKSGYRTAPVVVTVESGLDTRPTVFRFGRLPTRELPTWFLELDKDKDGQVGLYEWRAAGKALAEFKRMDTNSDGFVTADELIAVQKRDDAKDPKAVTFVRLNTDPGASDLPPLPNKSSDSSQGKGEGKMRFGKGKGGEGGEWSKEKWAEMMKGKRGDFGKGKSDRTDRAEGGGKGDRAEGGDTKGKRGKRERPE